MSDAEVIFCAACDGFRSEESHKYLAYGIYPDALAPFNIPSDFRISFMLWVKPNRVGDHELKFKLYGEPEPGLIAHFGIRFYVGQVFEKILYPISDIPVRITTFGDLVLKVGEEEREVLRLPIIPSLDASDSPQTSGQSPPESQA